MAENPAYVQITDEPGLPRVLIIGDSISIGYTLDVRALLKGAANVHRPPINCGPTIVGIKLVDEWLRAGKWDVIHFNFGLHDVKLVDGKKQVSPGDYEKNLQSLVARMKQTRAKLIFATTTPVPQDADKRIRGEEVEYNRIARRVMENNGVAINDLYAFALPQLAKIQKPANVHFSDEGSRTLATQVAGVIRQALRDESK
jgi:lysophospholipase L1-like esterase